MKFINYNKSYFDSCLSLFDENCPSYFAENEKNDYVDFLKGCSEGYSIGDIDSQVASAFGLTIESESKRGRLSWILVSPAFKGKSIGSQMMLFIKNKAIKNELLAIDIAASHLSAPFFSKFGAQELAQSLDGWGEGMHRVDMEIQL